MLTTVPPHAFNASIALNVPLFETTIKVKEGKSMDQRNKELSCSVMKSVGPSVELLNNTCGGSVGPVVELINNLCGGTGAGNNVDLGRKESTVELGLNDTTLLSFDKACSLVRSPSRRKKKAVK